MQMVSVVKRSAFAHSNDSWDHCSAQPVLLSVPGPDKQHHHWHCTMNMYLPCKLVQQQLQWRAALHRV
jgi:hypothetical protein